MHSIVLLTLLAAAPAPDQPPAGDNPPAKKELFAGEQWYKDQKGQESEFIGVLKRLPGGGPGIGRFNPYRLVMNQTVTVPVEVREGGRTQIQYVSETRLVEREVYVGSKPDLLAPYVGKTVKLIGKPVQMEVVGRQHNEIWPARLEVVAAVKEKEPQKKSVNEDLKEGKAAGKELKVIARAPWRFGVQDGTQHQYVIRTQEEFEAKAGKQAEQLLKALKLDKIDWKTQMVVMASAGAKPTGGYRVEIDKLTLDGNTLTVHWTLHKPKGAVTQAFTHPAETVVVERFEGAVKFDPPAAKGKEK